MTMTSWFNRPTPAALPSGSPAPTSVVDRQAVIHALTLERTRYAEVSRRLDTDAARTQAREDEITELHRAATARREEAHAAALGESLAHAQRIATLEAQLQRGAPECLDRFDATLLDVEAATRLAGETVISPGHLDAATGQRRSIVSSNVPGLERRLAAIQAARVAATALRLEALPETEILARLTALWDGIPEVEPIAVDQSWMHSPGELRQAEWNAKDSLAQRWSSEPYR